LVPNQARYQAALLPDLLFELSDIWEK